MPTVGHESCDAVSPPTGVARCQHCRESIIPAPVTDCLLRCAGCGFFFPRPGRRGGRDAAEGWTGLASIAPQGVLRERYRLIELIGRGAQGLTFYAQHEFLSHPCVVKILPHRAAGARDAAARRLRHEAQAGFRVNDPNVVRVLDCDVIEGYWFFVMEYVDGVDLTALTDSGQRVGWQQALHIATEAARGLAAIHHAGLVHFDVKPSNLILTTEGGIRIADLGVAGFGDGRPGSATGRRAERAGTLQYAAPEAFEPQAAVGPSADLYGLGATLYHVLTGRTPHDGPGVLRALIDAQNRPAAWPKDVAQDTPDWFVAAILRLLATEPEQRFPSAEALLEYLAHPSAQQPATASRAPRAETLQPRGVAVLPFRNDGETADDWLGDALADYLTQALSRVPELFVVDQQEFASVLRHRREYGDLNTTTRLLEAGRLVGAGTVLEGRFRRDRDAIALSVEAHRRGGADPLPVASAQGPLAKLVDLQAGLLDGVLRVLETAPSGRSVASDAVRPVALDAQEKYTLGKQAFLRGDYGVAIRMAEDALRLDPGFAEAVGFVGVCCARLGRYAEAAERHLQLKAIAIERGDQRLRVEADANMGAMDYFRGEYESAHGFYREAARVAEQHRMTSALGQIYSNLGFVLFRRERQAESEQTFSRAIEIHRAVGALVSLVGPYNGMGNVLLQQERYAEARSFYHRALLLAQEIGDRTKVGLCHMHLGRCASLVGRYAEAKNEFALALNALEETSFWNGLARAYEYVAEMHLRLGHCDEAVRCADQRIELARRHANRRMEAAAWQQKAEALRRAGRTEEAEACRAHA